MSLDHDMQNVPRLSDDDVDALNDDYSVAPGLVSDEAIAARKRVRALPTIAELLTQALVLLEDADEANHTGDYSTFELQRQARTVLAAALDAVEVRHG